MRKKWNEKMNIFCVLPKDKVAKDWGRGHLSLRPAEE
jgi:hypothetical protein